MKLATKSTEEKKVERNRGEKGNIDRQTDKVSYKADVHCSVVIKNKSKKIKKIKKIKKPSLTYTVCTYVLKEKNYMLLFSANTFMSFVA